MTSTNMMTIALMTMRWTTPSEKMMKTLMKKNIINMAAVPMDKTQTAEHMAITKMTLKETETTALEEEETSPEEGIEIIISF